MDSEDLSPALLRAGQEYLESLRKLRLDPEGLLWSRVNEIREGQDGATGDALDLDGPGEWHLVLITSAVDEGGPVSMQELLFKAYDASATPKEISPFIVEVISAKSPFVANLIDTLNNPLAPIAIQMKSADGKTFTQQVDRFGGQQMIHGLWFDRKWIYHLTGLRDRHTDRKRHWRDFKQSVNSLAA